MSLSGKIFVGLFAGIVTGLFFGELVADLKVVGDIFIKLLQITVAKLSCTSATYPGIHF